MLKFASILAILSAVCAAVATAVWIHWERDEVILRSTTEAVTGGRPVTAEVVARLNNWVYHDQGFAKNHLYFVIPRLGATPIQILRHGGDCADKSRLLSAMLGTLGVRSGLVMLYPCPTCAPVHTVVEVASGLNMVADPIWDIDYRVDRSDLARSNYAAQRVAYFRNLHRNDAKLRSMPAQDADFRYARAINFDASTRTRVVESLLSSIGEHPSSMIRPAILEDPEKFLFVLAGAAASILLVLSGALSVVIRIHAGGARR